MTFWNDQNFEPKRVFRWKVSLLTATGGTNVHVPSFFAKKITKPVLTVEEAEHKYLNKSFYFPGHLKWDPVTVTLIDDNQGTVVESITNMFQGANYSPITDVAGGGGGDNLKPPGNSNASVATLPKSSMVDGAAAGQNVTIEQLDADGTVIEAIILHNAWVKSFKPTELTYDTEDLSMYDVEFRYDWASYKSE